MGQGEREYLQQKFGDSVAMSFREDGSIRWDYYGKGKVGLEYALFDHSSNLYYTKWKGIDSLYYYDFGKNALLLEEKKSIADTVIDGISCRSLVYQCFASDVSGVPIKHTLFYNADTLQLDKKKYAGWKDFFMDDFFNESGTFYLARVLEQPGHRLFQRLVANYTSYAMDPKAFEVPKNISLVNF